MRLFWPIAAVSTILSILASQVADRFLSARIPIIGSFAGLQYSQNSGIAFGINLPSGLQEILILVALCAVFLLARSSAKNQLSQTGFGLIIGGGFANIIDRIPDGLVTDFVQIGSFPIFNVADSCVTVGVILLLLEILRHRDAS